MQDDLSGLVFPSLARVQTRATTDELLQLLRTQAAVEPSIFDAHPPFFFQAEISNTRLDAYYTHMDAGTTLVNYAQDAAAGVALLAAHNSRTLPFGQSLTGELIAGLELTRVLSDIFTIPGLSIDVSGFSGAARSTDQFIVAIKAGIQRDVSIGFHGGWFKCDICGNDMMDWRMCSHYPGVTYEVKGTDNVMRQLLCTATVVDARLSEVSAVYDGATPGAVILKAQGASERGMLGLDTARLMEARYRINLPGKRLLLPGADLKEPAMPPELTPAGDDERALVLNADLLPIVQRGGAAPELDLRAACEWLVGEVQRLRPLADDGRAYRTDLVTAALTEGVRAFGPEFAEETYRPLLEAAPLDTVKRMNADWQAIADAKLPRGRQSKDTPEPSTPAKPAAPATPAAAYS